ncbi:hypothetical protein BST22_15385 [Mycolicibacterium chubuense]|uniref:Uncharacterized protein n=1 Tax=Mycolicibacterium chubuense TaxID=1800 RepID=A0A0J6VW81_MYCCU|nr:hypothetical protein [Mycolicibacterium chubuense]KMO74384.1 hypothetical protein MCHUDSM44219_03645 [Mycolicibacterium chubuense]ORA50588.1 hypothetical protein BST22_15385 [Mycolicibacterium chubuense]SPY00097.1 response regulator receiver protein [Mycolicibacterium chubuense]
MTTPTEPGQFREQLRRDLRRALVARDQDRISALRTLIAAVDNAEAVPVNDDALRWTDGPIAGSASGVRSTEVPRRQLAMTDVHAVLRDLIGEYDTHTRDYRSMGRHDAADRLRRRADTLRGYLDSWATR